MIWGAQKQAPGARPSRYRVTACLWLCVCLCASICESAEHSESRPLAPRLEAETLTRDPFQLETLQGKTVLVAYWASWCSTCIEGLPKLKALYESNRDRGLEIVGISLDEEPKAARRAIAQYQLTWTQLCDGLGKDSPLARAFNVRGTPRYVLIDQEGRVAAEYVKPSELESTIASLLSEP